MKYTLLTYFKQFEIIIFLWKATRLYELFLYWAWLNIGQMMRICFAKILWIIWDWAYCHVKFQICFFISHLDSCRLFFCSIICRKMLFYQCNKMFFFLWNRQSMYKGALTDTFLIYVGTQYQYIVRSSSVAFKASLIGIIIITYFVFKWEPVIKYRFK